MTAASRPAFGATPTGPIDTQTSILHLGDPDLGDVYARPEPTAAFECLAQLDERGPAYSAALIRHVLNALADRDSAVIDLGSSYGVNAALVNHAVTLAGLYAHYRRDGDATVRWRIQEDRRFFRASRRSDAVPVVGIDVSSAAINYGLSVGLLDAGIASDLEQDRPDQDASNVLRQSTLISAGGPGYMGSRTIMTLVGASARPPVVSGFLLRWRDARPIAQSLAVAGYEFRAEYRSVYPQRRFSSALDRRAALDGLRRWV